MKHLSTTTLKVLTCAIFILALTSLAQAQAVRTWVSGVGDDLNPCSRTAPCKTFAGAISKTAIGGEIDALDAGGFGTINITKSITIDGGAAFASILASATTGVTVNVGTSANDPLRKVILRRLSINGAGLNGTVGTSTGIRGVRWLAGSQLYVEHCYIFGFTTTGVDVALAASGSVLSVKDTNISNTVTGVQVTTSSGFVTGTLDNVKVENCTTGITAKDGAFLTVRDSTLQGTGAGGTVGIAVQAASSNAGMNIENSVMFNLATGFAAGLAGSKADISDCSFLGNSTGVSSSGATVNSHGNNRFGGNTSDGAALNPIGQK